MNSKTNHIILEVIQGLGLVAVICSLPNVTTLSPWVGIVGGIATASATYLKQYGNVPPTTPPSNTP